MFEFDHLAICCTDLAEGTRWVETTLGAPLSDIGHHPAMGTHNRLMSLGGSEYLEVIAIDPAAPPPGRPRWFDLDRFTGPPALRNWVLRCADLTAAALPGVGTPMDLARGPYAWRMAVPEDGRLPMEGLHPALIEWRGPHPAPALAASGVRLTALTLRHPEVQGLAARLALTDNRFRFETGAQGMVAEFDTPLGPRRLG